MNTTRRGFLARVGAALAAAPLIAVTAQADTRVTEAATEPVELLRLPAGATLTGPLTITSVTGNITSMDVLDGELTVMGSSGWSLESGWQLGDTPTDTLTVMSASSWYPGHAFVYPLSEADAQIWKENAGAKAQG